MKGWFAPLLASLLAACSGSPPPPPPAPAAPPAPEPASRAPSLELGGTTKDTVLIARDPEGHTIYEVKLENPNEVIAAPDGGAYVVVNETTKPKPGKTVQVRTVVRFDAKGAETFRVPLEDAKWKFKLVVRDGRLSVFDLAGKHLYVLDAATGARISDKKLDPKLGEMTERGGIVVVSDANGVTRIDLTGERVWSVRVRMFPTPDSPSHLEVQRKVAVGTDGTVLTGASDGSLVALDPDGKPLYQLGVRGAVSRIEARPGGDFVVVSSAGVATVLGPGGVVRRESTPAEEIAPPDPGRVVDKRKGKSAPPAIAKAPPSTPTIATRALREGPSGSPLHRVRSVVAIAPDDVWALALAGDVPGGDDSDVRLFHFDGRSWSDHGKPTVKLKKEVFAQGQPAAEGRFFPQRLARGANGALLVLGLRIGNGIRPCVLERTGKGLRERRDLFATLAKIEVGNYGTPTFAASPSGREVLCVSRPEACIEAGRGTTPRILPKDEGHTLSKDSREAASLAGILIPVVFAGETLWKTNGSASAENDVWGFEGATVLRWNGSVTERFDSPLGKIGSAWAGGRDDLWLTGADGVAHFDGQRWHRILGVPHNKGSVSDLSVVGSRRGDAWVYGSAGLFHLVPDPSAEPDLEGTRAPTPPAAAPSVALPIAGVDGSYRLERVTVDVDGGKPLRAAIGVAEGPGGVLWFHEGPRVIEHDGVRGRVLYEAPAPKPFVCWYAPGDMCNLCSECSDRRPNVISCQRCAAPSGAGAGAMLGEDGWLRVQGGRAGADPFPLFSLLSLQAAPSGAIWAVSASDDDLPHAVVRGPRGTRLLSGLPPAAYADLAVRADDDAWFAGALTSSELDDGSRPVGEGTLVRFDGRAFTRHRAPDGALLSVASAGPGEAWAVGVSGGVLHAKAGMVSAFHLEGEGGGRLSVLLRGVAASGPNEVWMVGDGATLLRWDGSALRRVDASAAGREAAFAAVVAPGAKPGWVVGPGGIWKVVRR